MEVGAKTEFQCTRCPKKFGNLRGLLRHKKSHSPALYFFCRRCECKERRRDNLRRHYKVAHPDHLDDMEKVTPGPRRGHSQEADQGEPTRKEARRVVVGTTSADRPSSSRRITVPWHKFRSVPRALSPLRASPDKERPQEEGKKSPAKEDHGNDESPPLDNDTLPGGACDDDEPEVAPTKKAESHKPVPANGIARTPGARTRFELRKPRIPKTATIVEETLTRTYVDGVEIHRETRQRRYFQDVLIDCPLLLTK